VIKTCHKRQVHAIGGMSAIIPVKGDDRANEVSCRVASRHPVCLSACWRLMVACSLPYPCPFQTLSLSVPSLSLCSRLSTVFFFHLNCAVCPTVYCLQVAFGKVRADKLREVTDGHDGTWVAHPGLIPVAKEVGGCCCYCLPALQLPCTALHFLALLSPLCLLCLPAPFAGPHLNIPRCWQTAELIGALLFPCVHLCQPAPCLPAFVVQVFDQHMRGPNQIQSKARQEYRTTQEELLKVGVRWGFC
jgi:hypothetical protein